MTEASSYTRDDSFSSGGYGTSDQGSYGSAGSNPDIEVPSRGGRTERKGVYGAVENKLMGLAEDGKAELAKSFDGIVEVVRELASRVESVGGGGPVATYANKAVDMLGDLQMQIRNKPVDELLDDGRELIRHSPGLALGVAVAAGFIGARLVKAGSR